MTRPPKANGSPASVAGRFERRRRRPSPRGALPGSAEPFWSSITPRNVTGPRRAGSTGSPTKSSTPSSAFLLLDREAPQDFGWWHELTVLGPPNRRGLFYASLPTIARSVGNRRTPRADDGGIAGRSRIANRTASEFDAHSGEETKTPISTGVSRQSQFGNPLNLVMAGVIALDRGPQAALALRRLDAARQIAAANFAA